ncbi:hypothetical protein C8R43DRAFT_849756, partial [Mycena crocata]
YDQYTSPQSGSQYSTEYFSRLTIAEADHIVKNDRLPTILRPGSILQWMFDKSVPTDPVDINLSVGEFIPCSEDLHQITSAMEYAYHQHGARSVILQLAGMPQLVQYHLSKIRLITNVNNNNYGVRSASNLLVHMDHKRLLLPHLLHAFGLNRVNEPITGFFVTQTQIYNLGCLLNERWALEDILNAWAELIYFQRAASIMEDEPSFLFFPTLFINDCRILFESRRYSQNLIEIRERIRAGKVQTFAFVAWTTSHYSSFVKFRLDDIEFGDSLHLPAAQDILRILRWVLADLSSHEPGPQTEIRSGSIDRQSTMAGCGSCGIAATNFVAVRTELGVRQWRAKESETFRDEVLRDLILYHLISKRKTSSFADWVIPCTRLSNGEWAGFEPAAVGYNDFNMYMPAANHPIFDWLIELKAQPVVATNTPNPRPTPTTPPPIKSEFIDLCTPSTSASVSPPLRTSTPPPRLATKQEIIDLSLSPMFNPNISPLRPSTKRKHVASPHITQTDSGDVIDLISPPRIRPKLESTDPPQQRHIQPALGHVRVGAQFENLDEAIEAVYSQQEKLGHKWVFGQSWKTDSGVIKKRTLRCNCYRNATPTHRIDLHPSDHRQGKSAKTQCMAHVNVNRLQGSTHRWYLSTVDLKHNHDRQIPVGGVAPRPPKAEHRDVVGRFADSFSRQHISKVLRSHFPGNTLEDRQISNMLNDARRQARDDIASLGGDVPAILAAIEEFSRSEPGWDFAVRVDEDNVVVALWWQSPAQAELTRRFSDIILTDNSYNRNNKQYPLNIGIIIDSHGKSRNGWYAFQKKEDTETHAWILRHHLKATAGVHPEVLISDRDPALIAAVAIVLVFTFHVYCLSHLLENIDKNLRRALGADWQNFQQDFWAAY